jgi:hypothetical protein
MEQKKVIALRRTKDAVSPETSATTDMCVRCHMQVARFAPQVAAAAATYHRECFETWYFGRHGRRPSLLPGVNGDRHRFQVRDRAAA